MEIDGWLVICLLHSIGDDDGALSVFYERMTVVWVLLCGAI